MYFGMEEQNNRLKKMNYKKEIIASTLLFVYGLLLFLFVISYTSGVAQSISAFVIGIFLGYGITQFIVYRIDTPIKQEQKQSKNVHKKGG